MMYTAAGNHANQQSASEEVRYGAVDSMHDAQRCRAVCGGNIASDGVNHPAKVPHEDEREDEDRFIMLGMSFTLRVLVVCHCYREDDSVTSRLPKNLAYPTRA